MLNNYLKTMAFLIILATVSTPLLASFPWDRKKPPQHYREQTIYLCELTPFMEHYRAAAYRQDAARYFVMRECEKGRRKGDIFCDEKHAKCTSVPFY